MRMFIVIALILMVLAAVLGLAFLAGARWIGGLVGGFALMAAALVLIVAPWIGDLAIRHDSLTSRTAVRLSWWGSFVRIGKPEGYTAVYLLGIPVRKRALVKRTRQRAPAKRTRKRPKAERQGPRFRVGRWAREHLGPVMRLVLLGLEGANELFWSARELTVSVQAPTGLGFLDQGLAKLLKRRQAGPLVFECTAEGERRLVATYRIGLLQVALLGLRVFAEGRALALLSSLKRARREVETEAGQE